jgi:iron-sulfur cluster assembly protein
LPVSAGPRGVGPEGLDFEQRRSLVLTLTPTAADVVRQLAASVGVEDEGGLRIAAGEPTPEGTPLAISVVEGPEVSDDSIDENGVHIFLEPPVAEFLDDKVLDAEVVDDGVKFAVLEQGDFDPRLNGRRAP